MIIAIIVAVLLLVLDIVSKYIVCAKTILGEDIEVIKGVLTFTYSENTGAAFSFMRDNPAFLLIVTIVCVVGMLGFYVYQEKKGTMHPVLRWALLITLSGALGNLYDRLVFGYVRDFIDYVFIGRIIGGQFAICNFADLVLIVGCILLFVYVLFFYSQHYDTLHPEEKAAREAKKNGVAQAGVAPDGEVGTDTTESLPVNGQTESKRDTVSTQNADKTATASENASESAAENAEEKVVEHAPDTEGGL